MTTLYYTYSTTSGNPWWGNTPFLDLWGEPHEPQKQNKESKCSVQEPPRKKNLRYLNRPA